MTSHEALKFGRNFRFGLERTYNLRVRAEFQNVFNRLTLPALPTPSVQAGFRFVNLINGAGIQSMNQIVARITF